MPKIQKRKSTSMPVLSCLELNAAGVDVGATEIYIAVPADRDPQPVRRFSTFTEDLHVAADWLKACGIETVAMESTGVYWIPFFQILEARGFRVLLVNAHHVKNVPGRKSDVSDCQWIQYLLSVGLLRASFRPEQAVCTVRSILRHRDNLVQLASTHIQHMQKALDQMNLQLHHVISNITGLTGMAIVEAILEGKRDPLVLAKLRDPRIKATENTIAKALVGDYRPEHLFTLRQSLAAYRHYQQLIAACDVEIERYLASFQSKIDPTQHPLQKSQDRHIFGVDLTQIPGVNALTAHALLAEIGPDLSCFANASAFASWLGLCPDNRIRGGNTVRKNTDREESCRHSSTNGGSIATSKPLLPRSVLPPNAHKTRHSQSDHRCRTQTCAHHLPPAEYAEAL
jgi:transposase